MRIHWLLLTVGATTPPPLAPPAATWQIAGPPGAVTRLTGEVKTGGRIVADRFVTEPSLVRDERGTLLKTPAPRGSCGWASGVRPFTRLRRFAANGRLLWEWHIDRVRQALRLNAVRDGDCLSPDGGRLTVSVYRFAEGEPVSSLGEGLVAVDHHPRFVAAIGARTKEEYGGSQAHYTDLIGWKRSRPATLVFEVTRDETRTVIDEAVLGGPRKR